MSTGGGRRVARVGRWGEPRAESTVRAVLPPKRPAATCCSGMCVRQRGGLRGRGRYVPPAGPGREPTVDRARGGAFVDGGVIVAPLLCLSRVVSWAACAARAALSKGTRVLQSPAAQNTRGAFRRHTTVCARRVPLPLPAFRRRHSSRTRLHGQASERVECIKRVHAQRAAERTAIARQRVEHRFDRRDDLHERRP